MPVRIVVLDAEPVVRTVVTRILECNRYTVVPIETVQAAVELVRSTPLDLLLTNVHLRGMTAAATRCASSACVQNYRS